MTTDILFNELGSKIGVITLNRPQVLNAINHDMFMALNQQLIEWENNPAIQLVVIKACVGRAFSAGGDIRLAYERGRTQPDQAAQFFRDEYQVNRRIFHYKKPYIALLNGITMGGGAGLSLLGSHQVVTEHFLFAMPETAIGFFPDVGASYFLSRIPHHLGIYLGLTGARIGAADALSLKLVTNFIPSSDLEKLISALSNANRADIDNILSRFSRPLDDVAFKQHQAVIEKCFSEQTVEAILIALENEGSDWSKTVVANLKTKSPTSLKVTLRALQKGSSLNFDACMDMEFRLTQHFIKNPDFYEGVRSVIIDKDQSPRWSPATLQEVTDEMVEGYFI